METPDLVKLMPPILLGFGGVLPVLIATSPFSIRTALKPLLAVIFVLVIWASYLMAYMLCTLVFYHYSITIAALVLSVVLFGSVYVALNPAETAPGTSSPAPPAWAFPLYTLALAILAAGAANYVGPSGYVVVKVRVVEAVSRNNIPIQKVFFSDGASEFSLESKAFGEDRLLILQKKLFDSVQKLSVQFNTPTVMNQRREIAIKNLQFILHPSLTEMYLGQIEYH